MKKYILIRQIILFIAFAVSITAFSQNAPSPTGGYQGGNHGNIKYTLWTGSEDDDWSNPDNWCPAVVPDQNKDVVIPADALVMPEVKSSGIRCKSLTIQPGAEVTIKTGYVLTVNGTEIE